MINFMISLLSFQTTNITNNYSVQTSVQQI